MISIGLWFSKSMAPAMVVNSGEIIMFETMDALGNQIDSEDNNIIGFFKS